MRRDSLLLALLIAGVLTCGIGRTQDKKHLVASIDDLQSPDSVVVPMDATKPDIFYEAYEAASWNEAILHYGCKATELLPEGRGIGPNPPAPLGPSHPTKTTCSELSTVVDGGVVVSPELGKILGTYAAKSNRLLSCMDGSIDALALNSADMFCGHNDLTIDGRTFAKWVKTHAKPLRQIACALKEQDDCTGALLEFNVFKLWIVHYPNGKCLFEPELSGRIFPDIVVKNAYVLDMYLALRLRDGKTDLPFIRTIWDHDPMRFSQVTVFWSKDKTLPPYPSNLSVISTPEALLAEERGRDCTTDHLFFLTMQ